MSERDFLNKIFIFRKYFFPDQRPQRGNWRHVIQQLFDVTFVKNLFSFSWLSYYFLGFCINVSGVESKLSVTERLETMLMSKFLSSHIFLVSPVKKFKANSNKLSVIQKHHFIHLLLIVSQVFYSYHRK